MVLLGGHHRVRAAMKFLSLHEDRSKFDWSTWMEDGDMKPAFTANTVKVDLIYLGKTPEHKLVAATSSALNSLNGDAYRASFFDTINQVYLLRYAISVVWLAAQHLSRRQE